MSLNRIVIVHDKIEARGGATGLARLSAIEYRKKGYDVTYFAGARDDQSLSQYGIEVIAMGQDGLTGGSRVRAAINGVYNQTTVRSLKAWLKANDTPDTAYHLHNWAQILSPSVFSALRDVADRTVVSCHDFFNVCPNGGLLHFPTQKVCDLRPMSIGCWTSGCDKNGAFEKYWRMVRHMMLQTVNKHAKQQMTFVCLHAGMQKIMRDAGFDPQYLTNIPNPAIAYTDTRVQAEKHSTFIYVGRLNQEKGADLAISAAQQANVPLTLIGEGDQFPRQGDNTAGITFAGFCNRSQISEIAQSARALVLPGRWREPYGLVIAEAALSGIPVIVSNPTSLASQVSELELGTVFDLSDPHALATTLRQWSADDEMVERFSRSAFANAKKICSTPESWSRQFVDLMEQKVRAAQLA